MTLREDSLTPDLYLKAIEGSDSGLWVLDVKRGICELSNRYYTMLGYRPGEFTGTLENLYSLLHPDDIETTNRIFADFFSGKTPLYRNEVRLKTKSGAYRHILTQGIGEKNSDGEIVTFIGWNIDITPLKEAQRKLDEERAANVAQARLAQLGLLTGGVTHEINNPLTTILIRTEMLLRTLKNDHPASSGKVISGLEEIQNASRKISDIVTGLKKIADGGADREKIKVSLNEVVKNVLTLCESELQSQGIRLHLCLPDNGPQIMANTALLSQVFLNLIKNAYDALETKKLRDIWISVYESDDKACFLIEDNGIGVSPQDQDKIMLPFFTTKGPGKGTGLGLSISKSIVNAHQGDLRYEAGENRSRFYVFLPLISL